MTDERKKRRPPISYRPPKDREEEFYARAAEHGGSINAFITDRTLGTRRRNRAELKMLARQLARDAALADLIRKLEEFAGRHPEMRSLADAMWLHLDEDRAALMRELGRKP